MTRNEQGVLTFNVQVLTFLLDFIVRGLNHLSLYTYRPLHVNGMNK